VEFQNRWQWPVAVYDARNQRRLVWDLNPLTDEIVCFTREDVVDGLRLKFRVKGWHDDWRYVPVFYDIRAGGDWSFTIEQNTRFTYFWNTR
jgi:hypothetical protein